VCLWQLTKPNHHLLLDGLYLIAFDPIAYYLLIANEMGELK
jgi:hypothetical protein